MKKLLILCTLLICTKLNLFANEFDISDIKQEIIYETIILNDFSTLYMLYYQQYNELIIRLDTLKPHYMSIEDGEIIALDNLKNWCEQKEHRYYHYKLINRKQWYSKKDYKKRPIIRQEYYIVLYKN